MTWNSTHEPPMHSGLVKVRGHGKTIFAFYDGLKWLDITGKKVLRLRDWRQWRDIQE